MIEEAKANLISAIEQYVQQALLQAEAGHNWQHIQRVRQTTRKLAKDEKANLLISELGALLHDIADAKFTNVETALANAENALKAAGADDKLVQQVMYIVKNCSYSGGNNTADLTPELAVVQDADRLDALGAVGIARAFQYGGYKNRLLYNPEVAPRTYTSAAEYHASEAPTINHFYEKLFLLKDKMNTTTAKQWAEDRHQYMVDFVARFKSEWEGMNNLTNLPE